MISDPYTALTALLMSNSTLTALLSTFKGTAIPLIQGGELEEQETGLPAITFTVEPSSIQNYTVGDYNFLINVYAEDARESFIVANTLIDEFNGCQGPVDGYFTQTTCNILTQVVDPTSKEVNTPIAFRLVNI